MIMLLPGYNSSIIFTAVFHRILDFKTGLDIYPWPFFYAFAFPGLFK